MSDQDTKPAIGLALSGGSVLGAAHVGVLYALEEAGIQTGWIAGTSAGAIIGALYAFNVSTPEIETIVLNSSWLNIGHLNPSRLGLMTNKGLGESLVNSLGDVNIEDSVIPFAATAVDIATGDRLLLKEGNLARAVRASACIPGVFQPVKWDGRMLVDGGLVEFLPIESARELGAARIIGVDLRSREPNPMPKNVFDIFMNTSWIVRHNSVRTKSSETQTIVTPQLKSYSSVDPRDVSGLIQEGYDATQRSMPGIITLVSG